MKRCGLKIHFRVKRGQEVWNVTNGRGNCVFLFAVSWDVVHVGTAWNMKFNQSLPACQKLRFHTLINRFTHWNYLHSFHVFRYLNVSSCLGKCSHFHMHARLVIKSHGPFQTDPGALPGSLTSLCIGSVCDTHSFQCITKRIFIFFFFTDHLLQGLPHFLLPSSHNSVSWK